MSNPVVDSVVPYTAELLLSQWLNHWLLQQIRPRRRQSTFLRYQRVANRQIVPLLGSIQIGQLTPSNVLEWQNRLLDNGLSASGVGFAHTILTGALRFAQRMEVISRNPASLVPRPPKRRSEARAPEIRAVKDLLALAESKNHFLYTCIRLIAYTGLRRGEVCALRWPSVNLEQGYLLVTGSLVRQLGGVRVEPPKTPSGYRRVDLDSGTTEVLRRYRQEREASGDQHDIVFADGRGGWLNPNKLTRVVSQLGESAGHPGITIRGLRHFHASVSLQTGQNVVVVSKRLGHSSVSITTDIYAHSLPGWQKETAEAFAAAMDSGFGLSR